MNQITFSASHLQSARHTGFQVKKALLLVMLTLISAFTTVSAAQYCQTPLTASDGVTVVNLTCQSASAGQYEIKIQSSVDMSGLGGSFANVNGVGGYQLNLPERFTLSEDKRTITIPITSTVAPSLYTPLYILMPGEKVFTWPANVEWGVCSTTADTELPTAFTATKGAVTFNSVELLLNATDNSGSVVYEITYGSSTATTTGTSGVEKSYIIGGLTASTAYTFNVTAKDAAGNTATNSPQAVQATTTVNTNTECAGTDTQKSDGNPFVNGFKYEFSTSGNDVTLSFELLDTKVGLVAYLWNRTSGFAETGMTNTSGQKYSITLASQTPAATLTFACKFAYAGGMTVTRDFTYTVGNACGGGVVDPDPEPAVPTINFETVGQDWAWTIFENGDNAASLYSVVANPASGGINTSVSAGKYIVNTNGQPWAGLWSNNLTDFTFSADNCIVKVMVYKDVISDFLVKFENDNSSVAFEKKVANTLVNQWEELTFDFTNKIGTAVTRLVIIPDFPATRTAGSTNYFDNITFGTGTPVVTNAPTTAAPTPTVDPAKVVSVFSNAYTNVAVDTWRTGWSNASYSEVMVAGNATKKYDDLVFVGIEAVGANSINATSMTYINVDVWTHNMTTFKIKLVDFGANNAWSGGDDVEHELTFSPTLSSWNSLKIPLSDFTNMTTRGHISQIIFSGAPTGTVFIDNIYFYDGTATNISNENSNKLSFYPNPVKDMLRISAESEISQIEIRSLTGQLISHVKTSSVTETIDMGNINAGNYLCTVILKNGERHTEKLFKN